MAHTIPESWAGKTATLTSEKIAIIVEWYESALRDEDVCTDAEDNPWYEGQRMAYKDVLDLLHWEGRLPGDPCANGEHIGDAFEAGICDCCGEATDV